MFATNNNKTHYWNTTMNKGNCNWGAKGLIVLATVFMTKTTLAEIPLGYYDSVDPSTPNSLKQSLHDIIDDHQRFPYTSSSTDTWDILEAADEDPSNPSNVIDIYKNASYGKVGGGNSNYNREHSWPKSYGFPKDGSDNSAYTDAHHLFIANSSYNSSRSNKPYANCDSACTEKATDFNGGRGGLPSESNWTAGSFASGSWQTWSGRKGDVARALMYMAVRYEGGYHGVTGHPEPDLILTDDRGQIEASNQGVNISVAYMGLKSVLLQWHKDDPVDMLERSRNDVVYGYQGNRNPFIDHPEYAECVFENVCSGGSGGTDTTPPNAPGGLTAGGGDQQITLAWNTNGESDLAGYNVYRSQVSGSGYAKVNGALLTTPAFDDSGLTANTTYFYVVTAVDTSGNESNNSTEASAVTDPAGQSGSNTAWINEFHYDNDGSDVNEFVEIAGTAGMSLNGWKIEAYNGNGGGMYKSVTLSGTIADQQSGFGVISVATSGLQNGSADGLALVDDAGAVVQFISYEGTLTATSGASAGMTSVDVGVSEGSGSSSNSSIYLTGSGDKYSDFTWQVSNNQTAGSINSGQTFVGAQPNQAPVASMSTSCEFLSCSLNANSSTDSDGTIVTYQWDLGDGNTKTGSQINHAYANEGSYPITLTVTDNDGATDQTSSSVVVTQPTVDPWINEIHYDNAGSDTNEFVEIAAPAGTDLSGWSLLAYNGNGGTVYKTVNLSGVIANQLSGYGVLAFDFSGLQNGAPDGVALVDNTGSVVQFISYEGNLTASNGAAAGMASTDIGVSETSSTPVGHSLQVSGTGPQYSDFNWQSAQSHSKGLVNTGQQF